jgi:hypothetical protein
VYKKRNIIFQAPLGFSVNKLIKSQNLIVVSQFDGRTRPFDLIIPLLPTESVTGKLPIVVH